MKPFDLVPDLETCEKMKAAGFEQDTLMGWHTLDNAVITRPWFNGISPDIAAPTLQEILNHLQELIAPDYEDICRGEMWDGENVIKGRSVEVAAQIWLKLNEESDETT